MAWIVLRSAAVAAATSVLLSACGAEANAGFFEDDVQLAPHSRKVKVRMFWVRHGQSCANVMDRCKVKSSEAERYLPKVRQALQKYGDKYHDSALKEELMEADGKEPDCMVELEHPDLEQGVRGDSGAIIRVHDLYKDPALTNCAQFQSAKAGKSLMHWFKASNITVDFLGSSFLMRAFDTASAMFIHQDADLRHEVFGHGMQVAPLPYMTEKAPAGYTSVERDNEPRDVDDQIDILRESAKAREDTTFDPERINRHYADSWPREHQQYEKLKAFLATQVVPSMSKVRGDIAWALGPSKIVKDAMESQLPEEMDPHNLGEQVKFAWSSGAYKTGRGFTKAEYVATEAPEINIVIVGHNQMMLEYCLGSDMSKKPNNNAVLEKLFMLEVTPGVKGDDTQYASAVMRELSEHCAKVMDAPSGKDSIGSLVYDDVANCQDPFDVHEWIGLEKPNSGSQNKHAWLPWVSTEEPEPTQCMLLADGSDSYPITPEFRPTSTVPVVV